MPRLAGPRADGMQMGGFSAATTAQRLSVDGDLAAPHGEPDAGEMRGDALGECGGLDGLKDPGKGVGARGAVGQPDPFAQPVFRAARRIPPSARMISRRRNRRKGDEEDFPEVMAGVAAVARILDGLEHFETFWIF
jgi:hypothetical protein